MSENLGILDGLSMQSIRQILERTSVSINGRALHSRFRFNEELARLSSNQIDDIIHHATFWVQENAASHARIKNEFLHALKGLSTKSIQSMFINLDVEVSRGAFHSRNRLAEEMLRRGEDTIRRIIHFVPEWKDKVREDERVARISSKKDKRQNHFEYLRGLRRKKFCGEDYVLSFPDVVSNEDQLDRLRLFNHHTNDAHMQQTVCASCVGRFDKAETIQLDIDDVPNKSRLQPAEEHESHVLYEGMLLHIEVVQYLLNGGKLLQFCSECLTSLQENKTPKFSLANNMWIGEVPIQLSMLTIPERLLISLYFPSAYILKLYPKAPNARNWHNWDVNFGLRGNVSTYKLDTTGIHDMIKGELMPRPPEILASVFSITLVGPKGRPENAIKDLCQIRRRRVLDALLWLKENNPFYHSIIIDDSVLNRLPDGDVPEPILHNIKHVSTFTEDAEKSSNSRPVDISRSDDDVDCYELQSYDREQDPHEDDETVTDRFQESIVLPLDESAVVDVDGFDIADSDLIMEALNNAASNSGLREPAYAVLRGNDFVNEYPRRDEQGNTVSISENGVNHLLGTFPYLFPYGMGGFETDRPVTISYAEHAQWALRYADGRFAQNITFLSLVFNVLQKRRVCLGAELQMKRSDYKQFERSINSITPSILQQAVKEERKGQIPSNPAVRILKSFVKATRKHVPGTDENRIANRSKIYGMSLMMNPANIWMTITYDDVNDPIVQIYSGCNIKLDNFNSSLGPDSKERLRNSTSNPYATTKFFFRLTNLILEDLFGIKVSSSGRIHRERGILGLVNGYAGMVEAQGRGSLHFHNLFWLDGSPSSSEMVELLKTESFRNDLELFIARNIKSHINGLNAQYIDSETSLQRKGHKERASAYSRPINPDANDFQHVRDKLEFSLVRSVQHHQCNHSSCLIYDKFGRVRCKRRAPWPLSAKDVVYESGVWYSEREYGFLNAWNPMILFATRSNNDMKLLTNGSDSRHITYYITGYATKGQAKTYQATALLADRLSYIKRSTQDENDIRRKNKKLLSQCAHTLTRGQELSNQQMVAYIMGYGDSLLSHRFVPVYLSGAMFSLERYFPEFRCRRDISTSSHRDEILSSAAVDDRHESSDDQEQRHLQDSVPENLNDNFNDTRLDDPLSSYCLQMTPGGLRVKSQLSDYAYRGVAMEDFSFLNFLLESYEPNRVTYNEDTYRHERVPYLPTSSLHQNRLRILRHPENEMMPDFLGSWIPRSDREEEHDFYCAVVMLLLKPWRSLNDLKFGSTTWSDAFDNFFVNATPRDRRIIDNFQFYYQSADAAVKKSADESNHASQHNATSSDMVNDDIITIPGVHLNSINDSNVNLDEIAEYYENSGEAYHGLEALDIATEVGIFPDSDNNWIAQSTCISNASIDLLSQNFEWQNHLKNFSKSSNHFMSTERAVLLPSVSQLDALSTNHSSSIVQPILDISPVSSDPVNEILCSLTKDQLRACKIVLRHLDNHLSGIYQTPLRMLICGSGGVGKSTVIRSIQKLFSLRSASHLLGTTATSGVAASNINGNTIHWWAGLPIIIPRTPNFAQKSSQSIKDRRNSNIANCSYLILDEVSMLCQETLGLLSSVVSDFCPDNSSGDPFGYKLSIILIGDFHQFPPTARPHLALFKPPGPSTWAHLGHSAFQLFDAVVILTEQKRIIDPHWSGILERVRHGDCNANDILDIQRLALRPHHIEIPDFNSEPWMNAILVTPRHGVRKKWNLSAIKKFAKMNRKVVLICHAQHSFRNGSIIDSHSNPNILFAIAREDKKMGKVLPRKVYLAIGLRILLTFNIRVSADLANGTAGVITNIFLDPREPSIPPDASMHLLQFPPKLIFFKPDNCSIPALPHLPQGILPIVPSTSSFKLTLNNGSSISIERTQYPIEAAYSFTDYKAQGSTIAPVILDLRSPPSATLNQFNLYVAMSRGISRAMTRILTPPDSRLFTTPPDNDLTLFDRKLIVLNDETKRKYAHLDV